MVRLGSFLNIQLPHPNISLTLPGVVTLALPWGQPVPVPDYPLSEEILPDIQSNPPLKAT